MNSTATRTIWVLGLTVVIVAALTVVLMGGLPL
jgi:hypothetical protein